MSTLLVPEVSRGRGSGHLRRCLHLLDEIPDSWILLPPGASHAESLVARLPEERVVRELGGAWSRIVLDRFTMEREEVRRFAAHGLTVGVDLGGSGRAVCEYLVDMLPRLDGEQPNLREPAFLRLPTPDAARTQAPDGLSCGAPILVSYGGEDPAHLTESTARLLSAMGYGSRTAAVAPSMRRLTRMPTEVRVLDPVPTLLPLLRDALVVITSFGMTAYEAAALGKGVVTVAPTRYHERLAKQAGFARAGLRRPSRTALARLLARVDAAASSAPTQRGAAAPDVLRVAGERKEFASWLRSLPLPDHRGCPAHPHAFGESVWRDEEKSYFVCPTCGLRYLERFAADQEDYSAAYFMEEYQAQYGKTYLEDFAHIYRMGQSRLRVAEEALQSQRPEVDSEAGLPAVLDVGCAYGPFLAAARDSGMEPYGVDVACEAVEYVRRSLGIPAVCTGIMDLDAAAAFARDSFDLVTLWYVIEHVPDLVGLLARISRLVRPGGVLGLSTPHGAGVSARRDADAFYAASPRDHVTIWDRDSARSVLAEHGFTVKRFVITGHHPERYPMVRAGRLPTRLAEAHSRIFGWGDTFEIYAVKEDA